MTVRIIRDPDGRDWLERRGGRWPDGWQAVINPHTFEPIMVSPETAKGLFGDDGMGKTSERLGPRAWLNGKKEAASVSTIGKTEVVPSTNWFQRERYTTYAYLRDLRKIPRFFINDPAFGFDSHEDNPGWMLVCKQRHFNGKPGKLLIKLVHESPRVRSTVNIRPSNHNLHKVVETEADFVEVFQDDFVVETSVVARQVHQPLSEYSVDRLVGELSKRGVELTTKADVPSLGSISDDELLAELKKRSDARLDGWRPRKRKADHTNVINLDDLRIRSTPTDLSAAERIVAA